MPYDSPWDTAVPLTPNTYTMDSVIAPNNRVTNFFWVPFDCRVVAIKVYLHVAATTAGTWTLEVFDEDNSNNLISTATFDLTSLVAQTLTPLTLTSTAADLELAEGTRIRYSNDSDNSDLVAGGLYFQLIYRRI